MPVPKLLGRMGGALSAACVPVNFMGRALGVLHVAGAKGKPPNPEQIAQLTALGVHAGNRIGTLRAFERSQLQASTDSLTGLTNRRVAEEVLASLHGRRDSAFAVVMADLDFFKRLNDTMGHDAGDRALKLFADTARSVVRDRDHVVRWGGEEFALLLPGVDAERAAEVVDRLRAALAQAHLLSNTPIFTASFGIADSTHGARPRIHRPARRRSAVSLEAGGPRPLHHRRSAARGSRRAAPRARSGRRGRHHAGGARQLENGDIPYLSGENRNVPIF